MLISIVCFPKVFSNRRDIPVGSIIYPNAGINFHAFASYAYSCQMLFCQRAVYNNDKKRMCYCWERSTSAAIPQTSTSDFWSKHNKIRDIMFPATLVNIYSLNLIMKPNFSLDGSEEVCKHFCLKE